MVDLINKSLLNNGFNNAKSNDQNNKTIYLVTLV